MLADLRRSLYEVPLVQTLGVVPRLVNPGHVVLELPHRPSLLDHAGALNTTALFGVAELAAGVLLATHPRLAGFAPRRVATTIRYHQASYGDVLANAELPAETLQRMTEAAANQEVAVTVTVRVRDAVDNDIVTVDNRFVVPGRADR